MSGYYEHLDEERRELGRSRQLAFLGGRGASMSMPLWNARYRVHIAARSLRWSWTVQGQHDLAVVGEGSAWTLGAAVWAAEAAAGA